MNVNPLQNHMAASDIPLERLAGNRTLSDEQKVVEASRQFEALLIRQILQETQKTVIKSSLSEDSATSEIYRDMMSNQLADSISKSGDFGLARSLDRQLTRQLCPKDSSGKQPDSNSLKPAAASHDK